MSRVYATKPTMFVDNFTEKVIQPDATLIKQLQLVLDSLPENQALIIDHIVAELLKFHNPNRQHMPELLP